MGATAEDNVAEMINHICEDVILINNQNALLPRILTLVVEICKFPLKYNHPELQQSACLALIRFMCVSSQICEQYMPFLMSLLEKSQNIMLRCNIITSLSDLTFRFPNIMEPWSNHFYAILHDSNIELRLTAVKTLSYLIQHEMIRVKGQIATLALCIIDENEEIKDLTQQFFKVIANKCNILYNVLPDIISKLSDKNFKLEEEKYRTIMRYILSLIQKDRQVETLVDKLCLRFVATHEERQWRDVAFCLSLLNYNERSLRKLIDNVQYYKDIVIIDEIYQLFKIIISNTMKFNQKPELKNLLTELETRINECFKTNERKEQEPDSVGDSTMRNTTKRGQSKSRKGSANTRGKGNKRVSVRRRRNSSSSSSEEDEESESSNNSASAEEGVSTIRNNKKKQDGSVVRSNRSTRNGSRKAQLESESEGSQDDDDDDVFEENSVALKKRNQNTSGAAKSKNKSQGLEGNKYYTIIEEETENSDLEKQTPRNKRERKHT